MKPTNLGPHLIIGFQGCNPEDENVQRLHGYLREGLIGGVIFFGYNIQSPAQIHELTQSFREASPHFPPFLALDQEGGKVQRLKAQNGFKNFPSAKYVAQNCTLSQAYELYNDMALDIKKAGFNLNFGPVVDLDSPIPCPVIGAFERSYSSDPALVTDYAKAFIQAHRSHKILTCIKHYPGHGFALEDSHKGMVNITETYQPIEEESFQILMDQNEAEMIMVAHLMNFHLDSHYPSSLSPIMLKKLRAQYEGILISDDYDMGAIVQHFSLPEILQQSLKTGMDLLIFSCNDLASKGSHSSFSINLIEEIHSIYADLIEKGFVSLEERKSSQTRLHTLRNKFS